MAGQFDRFIKTLGGGTRPDVITAVDKEGNPLPNTPSFASRPVVPSPEANPTGGKADVSPGNVMGLVNAAKRSVRKKKSEQAGAAISKQLKEARKNLATTTMRMDPDTGEAYDLEDREVKPTPSGRVFTSPIKDRSKYRAADIKRESEDRAAKEAQRSPVEQSDEEIKGMQVAEAEFNKREEAAGSSLRSSKGVTYDINDYESEVYGPKKKILGELIHTRRYRDVEAASRKFDADIEANRTMPQLSYANKPKEDDSDTKVNTGVIKAPKLGEEGYVPPTESAADIAMREGAK